jgi:predicted RNase H-like nuclease
MIGGTVRYLGVDLAWGAGTATRRANETGVAVLDASGRILDAGWLRGLDEVTDWLVATAEAGSLVAIDAPLVVHNPTGMRECEREVGRAYGRWRVAANASNTGLRWLAGVTLHERLEAAGFRYADGTGAPDPNGRSFFECYPYTTIVGTEELGYDAERPRYKRLTRGIPAAEGRTIRAVAFDELIRGVGRLRDAVPPVDLASHPVTRALLDEPSTTVAADHKHREDLLDAVLCAWTAALWHVHGEERVQVLGRFSPPDAQGRRATIVAPARPGQRIPRLGSPSAQV